MSKSVYSLILNDEVISSVDRLAYKKGISRSALINELLASAVSYVTPEMRMRQILDRLGEGLSESVFLQIPAGGSVYAARSRLIYKYNPSLRYSVELSKADFPEIGWLKVGMRSRNDQLLLLLLNFFRLWQAIEANYRPGVEYYIRDGRFERKLELIGQEDATPQEVGDAIVSYVNLLNDAINGYFAVLDDLTLAEAQTRAICKRYYHGPGTKI